jgi:hypothetical protein
MSFEGLHMARPPRPWYARGAWRTDFGGERNKVLVTGPKNSETKLQAEKALLELRGQVKLLPDHPGMYTPMAAVVERFLDEYADRVVYEDYRDELNWFTGADTTRGERRRRAKEPAWGEPSFGRAVRIPLQGVADQQDQRGREF